jgi:hypothetical protein
MNERDCRALSRPRLRHAARRRAAAAALVALAAGSALGQVSVWTGTDGSFDDPANWNTGVVPTSGTAAVYNGGTVRIDNGYWPVGIVAGATIADSDYPTGSGDGTIIQTGGRVDATTPGSAWFLLGTATGTTGRYELRGSGVLDAGVVRVGRSGVGEMVVRDRAILTTNALLVAGQNSPVKPPGVRGVLTISGPDALVVIGNSGSDSFAAGYHGPAEVRITDGAAVFAEWMYVLTSSAEGTIVEIDSAEVVVASGSLITFGQPVQVGRSHATGVDPAATGPAVLRLRGGTLALRHDSAVLIGDLGRLEVVGSAAIVGDLQIGEGRAEAVFAGRARVSGFVYSRDVPGQNEPIFVFDSDGRLECEGFLPDSSRIEVKPAFVDGLQYAEERAFVLARNQDGASDGINRLTTRGIYLLPPPPAEGLAYQIAHIKPFGSDQLAVRLACAADVNLDGLVDAGDVVQFIDTLSRGAFIEGIARARADLDRDGELTFGDVAAFVDAYTNHPCPPTP